MLLILTIKAVAQEIGVPAATLRNWEDYLDGVLIIPRDAAGSRYYTRETVDVFRRVKNLRDKGRTFEQIRHMIGKELQERPRSHAHVAPAPADDHETAAIVPQTAQNAAQATVQAQAAYISELRDEMRVFIESARQAVETAQAEAAAARDENDRLRHMIEDRIDATDRKLDERDRQLMETLRELREQKQRPPSLFGRIFGK